MAADGEFFVGCVKYELAGNAIKRAIYVTRIDVILSTITLDCIVSGKTAMAF